MHIHIHIYIYICIYIYIYPYLVASVPREIPQVFHQMHRPQECKLLSSNADLKSRHQSLMEEAEAWWCRAVLHGEIHVDLVIPLW